MKYRFKGKKSAKVDKTFLRNNMGFSQIEAYKKLFRAKTGTPLKAWERHRIVNPITKEIEWVHPQFDLKMNYNLTAVSRQEHIKTCPRKRKWKCKF